MHIKTIEKIDICILSKLLIHNIINNYEKSIF